MYSSAKKRLNKRHSLVGSYFRSYWAIPARSWTPGCLGFCQGVLPFIYRRAIRIEIVEIYRIGFE